MPTNIKVHPSNIVRTTSNSALAFIFQGLICIFKKILVV